MLFGFTGGTGAAGEVWLRGPWLRERGVAEPVDGAGLVRPRVDVRARDEAPACVVASNPVPLDPQPGSTPIARAAISGAG